MGCKRCVTRVLMHVCPDNVFCLFIIPNRIRPFHIMITSWSSDWTQPQYQHLKRPWKQSNCIYRFYCHYGKFSEILEWGDPIGCDTAPQAGLVICIKLDGISFQIHKLLTECMITSRNAKDALFNYDTHILHVSVGDD